MRWCYADARNAVTVTPLQLQPVSRQKCCKRREKANLYEIYDCLNGSVVALLTLRIRNDKQRKKHFFSLVSVVVSAFCCVCV
jgi:hypothetical protein